MRPAQDPALARARELLEVQSSPARFLLGEQRVDLNRVEAAADGGQPDACGAEQREAFVDDVGTECMHYGRGRPDDGLDGREFAQLAPQAGGASGMFDE